MHRHTYLLITVTWLPIKQQTNYSAKLEKQTSWAVGISQYAVMFNRYLHKDSQRHQQYKHEFLVPQISKKETNSNWLQLLVSGHLCVHAAIPLSPVSRWMLYKYSPTIKLLRRKNYAQRPKSFLYYAANMFIFYCKIGPVEFGLLLEPASSVYHTTTVS